MKRFYQLLAIIIVTSVMFLAPASVSASSVVPGTIAAYAGDFSTIPAGWSLADGGQVLQADYPEYYANVGCIYGCNGSYVSKPDLIGLMITGANPAATYPYITLTSTGGEYNHALNISEIPAHNHSIDPYITTNLSSGGAPGVAGGGYYGPYAWYGNTWSSYSGGGVAHNNMPRIWVFIGSWPCHLMLKQMV